MDFNCVYLNEVTTDKREQIMIEHDDTQDVDLKKQLTRETKMREDGIKRFEDKAAKQQHLSKRDTHHQVIESAIGRVANALDASIEAELSKGKGRKFLWVTILQQVPSETLAYIGLNAMMDMAGQKGTLTTSATSIGNRIETEVWAAGLETFSGLTFSKGLEKKVSLQHSVPHRRLEAVKTLSKMRGYQRKAWTLKRRVTAAMPVINAILEFSGIFYVHQEYTKKRTMKYIRILPEVQDSLNTTEAQAAWQQPMFGAMIVPPVPWNNFNTGVYLDTALSQMVPLVKDATYYQKEQIKRDFERCNVDGKLPKYVEALNAIQDVPLTVNTEIVDLVQWAWDSGKEIGKFPKSKLLKVPDRLTNWDELDRKEQMRHVSNTKKINEKNDATRTAAIVMNRDLATARELDTYKKFWIGWNLDTRGRVYPVSHFNFHRDDHIKAMFSLSNKYEICKETDEWLMIHIANLGDFDKISKASLVSRVNWFKQNEDEILKIACDPKDNFELWAKADKPFQYLAACFEWLRYKLHGCGFACAVAPSLDGSNSGCQHYSAASRSSETGKLVNLVSTDAPQDVYQTLADEVNKCLNLIRQGTAKGSEDNKFANLWLDYGVGRKELKTNCMTYPYSSRKYGFSEQLKKQIMEELTEQVLHSDKKIEHHFGDIAQQNAAATFLAKISFACVQNVLSPAKEGMEFFQACAAALAKENKPMHWRTPIGFPVTQKYTKWNSEKIKVYLYDRTAKVKKRSQISLQSPDTDKICIRQAKSGISPNIIHSMDSSHLLSTVLALKQDGIDDFMMIHDSFAVTASASWNLFNTVRETFHAQYTDFCLYDLIYQSTMQQLSDTSSIDDLKLPPKGDLQLDEVLNSDYCFA